MLANILTVVKDTYMIERIGIIGGGQLGRMLTESATPLGYQVEVIDPSDDSPAKKVGAEQIKASLTDTDAIDLLAERNDMLTWEVEHIPAEYLALLASNGVDIEPSPETLAVIQDKLAQKQFLQSKGIPVAPFSAELGESAFLGGGPFVVKSRKGGYDGRGNLVVDSIDRKIIKEHFGEQPVYVEQALAFEKELAVIAARDKSGSIST